MELIMLEEFQIRNNIMNLLNLCMSNDNPTDKYQHFSDLSFNRIDVLALGSNGLIDRNYLSLPGLAHYEEDFLQRYYYNW
jgi:hypothetical protein